MSRLEICVLGPPSLTLDSEPADTSRNKAVALLVYLAVTAERHRRDALAALFWPEHEQAKAYAYLRRTLWEIKDVLGEGWLDTDRETVGIDRETGCWLDVTAFRDALAATTAHGHAPASVCPACIEPLSKAAGLYRGDFLQGFSLRDSQGFDDWQFYIAEGLRQEAGEVLRKLSAIHGRQHRLDAAIEYGRRWLVLDPINEDAHRQLMLLHALNGQRTAALRQYQECVRILLSEMGIAPEQKTTDLFQRIKQGRIPAMESTEQPPLPSSAPPTASPPEIQQRPAHHNLPQLLTPFIGRDHELEELNALLADPDVRLLTILAVGGMGKTRLAIETAARQYERFEDGVTFLYLAPLQSSEALVPALLEALNLSAREGMPQKFQVLDYLRGKQALLVLDNFEHLLPGGEGSPGTELVREILETAPGVKILATSRLPLSLQGEHRYHLAGMDFPSSESRGNALETSAVKLFVQGARRALPSFRLSTEDLEHIVAICRAVEGMPLGILLAAGWVELLTPREMAARVRGSWELLETDVQDVPQRHRSMRLVLENTWDLMSDGERRSLEKLSVFRGSFDRQAGQEVSGASLRVLMSLVNKSLLIRLANDQLAVHELLRQYASQRLSDDIDAYEMAHDRHSAVYCRRLQELAIALKTPGQPLSPIHIELAVENARAAWTWAALDRQGVRLGDSAEGFGLLLSWQNRNETGEEAFRFAADALDPPANDDERVLLGYLLAWQARFAGSRLNAPDEVHRLVAKSLALLQGAATTTRSATRARAFALFVKGQVELTALNHGVAADAFEESLALFEEVGESWWIASVLERLGSTAWACNDLERTAAYFQRSLAVLRQLGDQVGTAGLLINLGGLAGFDGGRVDEAEELFMESSRLYAAIGGRPGELASLAGQQAVDRLRGRFAEALDLIRRQMDIAQDLGDRGSQPQVRMVLGEVLQLMGRYEQAEAEHRKNIADLQAAGWAAPETWARYALAASLLGSGKYEEARQLLQPNINALRQSNSSSMLGRSLAIISRADLGLGEVQRAWQHALRAVGLLAGRHYFWLLEAMAAAAAVLAQQGDAERALEIHSLLNQHPYVAKSRWFEDVFGSLIDKAAQNLAPDTQSAARARGAALDLWQSARELLADYPQPAG